MKKCQAKNPALCVDAQCPERVFHRDESFKALKNLNSELEKFHTSLVSNNFSTDKDSLSEARSFYQTTVAGIEELVEKRNKSTKGSIKENLYTESLWVGRKGFAERYYKGDVAEGDKVLRRYIENFDDTKVHTKNRNSKKKKVEEKIDRNVPQSFDSEAVMNGEVFDKVSYDGIVFERSREGRYPSEPQSMRFQSKRRLSSEDVTRLSQLIGYNFKSYVSQEGLSEPIQDTPYSFIVFGDSTKGGRRDFDSFEDNLSETIENGSPKRKTNRSGPIGSRLVEGLGEKIDLEVYYDDMVN